MVRATTAGSRRPFRPCSRTRSARPRDGGRLPRCRPGVLQAGAGSRPPSARGDASSRPSSARSRQSRSFPSRRSPTRLRSPFHRRTLPAILGGNRPLEPASDPGGRALDALSELVQPRLHHRALGFGVCGERFDPAAELLLLVQEALLERGDCLRALAVEAAGDHVQTLLEALCARVADVTELLGEHALRLARECLYRAVELA